MSSDLRRFLLFLAGLVPVVVLVFLASSDFFHSWQGHVVAVQSWEGEAPLTWTALVVEEDGDDFVRDFPAEALRGRRLPAGRRLVPPRTIPEEAARTSKSNYTLNYLVEDAQGTLQSHPTPTPGSLGLALFTGLLLTGLFNMLVSGSPLSFRRQLNPLPKALPEAGRPAKGPPLERPKKGPPPSRRRKGKGRRRR